LDVALRLIEGSVFDLINSWAPELSKNTPRRASDKRLTKLPKKSGQSALSAADWVAAASDLLAKNNVNSVEVHNLCRRLGVTKGSFYWHFNGRCDLLSAILDNWRSRMTLDVKMRASAISASPRSVLHYLLGLIRKPRPSRNASIERSIRDWARVDPIARNAVIEVDNIRLEHFESLFRTGNFSEKEARLRAYAAYAIMMGDSILKETIRPTYPDSDYIDRFVELLLGESESSGGSST
jgi:AcrR family transcriptional regulator